MERSWTASFLLGLLHCLLTEMAHCLQLLECLLPATPLLNCLVLRVNTLGLWLVMVRRPRSKALGKLPLSHGVSSNDDIAEEWYEGSKGQVDLPSCSIPRLLLPIQVE